MSGAWITLSCDWDFANVQATINIVVSLIATMAIWTFSRLWYQRNAFKIIQSRDVPLSSLFTVTNTGEAWDILRLLRGRLFRLQYLSLLTQTILVLLVTLMAILAGPISRYSLRTYELTRSSSVAGLLATGGGREGMGEFGQIVSGQVLWKDIMDSLSAASFPTDQLLDYLPSTHVPWTYRPEEWNSTWRASCTETEPTTLDLTGDVSHTIKDPVLAFPAFGATYDPKLLNATAYRRSVDFCGWLHDNDDGTTLVRDIAFFVLVQSEPSLDDQMVKNEAPLFVSISVLHIRNATLYDPDKLFGGRDTWRVGGTVEMSDYSRVECTLARTQPVVDPNFDTWPWTNDTGPIVTAYADFNRLDIMHAGDRRVLVPPPPPRDIFRFYQAYMISMMTLNEFHVARVLSVNRTAVQLSTGFLVVMLLLVVLIVAVLIRYVVFNIRHRETLDTSQVPDAKLDWMLHAFKNSTHVDGEDRGLPDHEMFKEAMYESAVSAPVTRGAARVFSRRQSTAVPGEKAVAVIESDGESKLVESEEETALSVNADAINIVSCNNSLIRPLEEN